jgi:hypothetical protein
MLKFVGIITLALAIAPSFAQAVPMKKGKCIPCLVKVIHEQGGEEFVYTPVFGFTDKQAEQNCLDAGGAPKFGAAKRCEIPVQSR